MKNAFKTRDKSKNRKQFNRRIQNVLIAIKLLRTPCCFNQDLCFWKFKSLMSLGRVPCQISNATRNACLWSLPYSIYSGNDASHSPNHCRVFFTFQMVHMRKPACISSNNPRWVPRGIPSLISEWILQTIIFEIQL